MASLASVLPHEVRLFYLSMTILTFLDLQNEEEDDEIPTLLTAVYTSLDLKTLAMRTLIRFKLETENSILFNYLPKTLSTEFDNFCKLFGKYRAIGGRQSVWKCKNGKIELTDQYSFDYQNWFSSIQTSPLREMVDARREEKEPFLVKIVPESRVHGRIAILVSKSNSSYYETEHLVELKDRAVWAYATKITEKYWSKTKCFKQEFFCNGRLMIIFWNIIDNRCHGVDSASEFYFDGGFLIWKKYQCLNMLFYVTTEYKMERIVCKFNNFYV